MNQTLKYYKVKEDEITTFYDSLSGNKKMQYFFTDGEIVQIRFFLSDGDNRIKNKILVLNKNKFKERVILFYEKHYYKKGIKFIEHYTNDVLESYFEIEKNKSYTISKGFSANGKIFSIEKIELDIYRNPLTEEQLIYNSDGTKASYKCNITKTE